MRHNDRAIRASCQRMIHRDGEMVVFTVAYDANAYDVLMPRQQAKCCIWDDVLITNCVDTINIVFGAVVQRSYIDRRGGKRAL